MRLVTFLVISLLLLLGILLLGQQKWYNVEQISNLVFDEKMQAKRVIDVTPPIEYFENYSVDVSSYMAVQIVKKEKRKWVMIHNTSLDYSLFLSSFSTLNKDFCQQIFPRSMFATDGIYEVFGFMEDGASKTKIRVTIEK